MDPTPCKGGLDGWEALGLCGFWTRARRRGSDGGAGAEKRLDNATRPGKRRDVGQRGAGPKQGKLSRYSGAYGLAAQPSLTRVPFLSLFNNNRNQWSLA